MQLFIGIILSFFKNLINPANWSWKRTTTPSTESGITMWMVIGCTLLSLCLGYGLAYKKQADYYTHEIEQLKASLAARQQQLTLYQQSQNLQTYQRLTTSLASIDTQREEAHVKTETYFTALLDKYTNPTLTQRVQSAEGLGSTDRSNASAHLSTATQAPLAEFTDRWWLSGQDRRFLLTEAKRADKQADELKACKAFVDSLYQEHATYIEQLKKQGNILPYPVKP